MTMKVEISTFMVVFYIVHPWFPTLCQSDYAFESRCCI